MAGERCGCGAWKVPALRYEASRTVETRCCFRCGEEDPPLYRRSRFQRNGPESVPCKFCKQPFPRRSNYPHQQFCGRVCQGRAWAANTHRIRLERLAEAAKEKAS